MIAIYVSPVGIHCVKSNVDHYIFFFKTKLNCIHRLICHWLNCLLESLIYIFPPLLKMCSRRADHSIIVFASFGTLRVSRVLWLIFQHASTSTCRMADITEDMGGDTEG